MIKNRLVLIDAFALIYRAYFALPPRLTLDDQPIHAAYGFTSALLAAIKTLTPEYLAVGMDKGKSHRLKEFEKYKIHRKPTPDDLVSQIPFVKKILETMEIPTFAVEGFEGEDIVATIIADVKAQMSNDKKIDIIIVTGDMDLLQLIDTSTKVYSTRPQRLSVSDGGQVARGINQAMLYDEKKVIERYGLKPTQFVDYKALRGDPSDNIPGVPGIGEKGAIKLIQDYGSIEKLYDKIANYKFKILNESGKNDPNLKLKNKNYNIDDIQKISDKMKISKKTMTLLIEYIDQAFLSYKLSKIRADAPLDFNLKDAKVNHYNQKAVIALLEELGFKSLIARLPIEIKEESEQQKLF